MNSRIKIIKGISETINEEIHENKEITNILKSLIDGVSIINLKGIFTSVNDNYVKTFGYCEEELLGKKWVKILYKDDLPLANECYENMLKNGKSESILRCIKKDGEIFYKTIILVSKFGMDEKMNGYYCLMK